MGLNGQAVEREACQYTSCYCEENVFLLLRQLHQSRGVGLEDLFVAFISNPHKHVRQLGAWTAATMSANEAA